VRAVIVIGLGLVAIVAVVIAALEYLPGPIAQGQTDNKSAAIGGIVGAALTAIGTTVSAYFGIRAANAAREGTEHVQRRTQTSQERTALTLAHVAGAAPGEVPEALERAQSAIRDLGI